MDSYLPSDFFIADETPRATRGEASAFTCGLRDWSRPRGEYPRAKVSRGIRRAHPERVKWAVDQEWQPL